MSAEIEPKVGQMWIWEDPRSGSTAEHILIVEDYENGFFRYVHDDGKTFGEIDTIFLMTGWVCVYDPVRGY